MPNKFYLGEVVTVDLGDGFDQYKIVGVEDPTQRRSPVECFRGYRETGYWLKRVAGHRGPFIPVSDVILETAARAGK